MPSFLATRPSFVAVDKPPGIPVVPPREAGSPSLRDEVAAALGARIWVVHRLDRDTSGVVLFARTAAAHRTLSMAFEAGAVAKRYLALVKGRLAEALEIDAPLVPARRGRMRVAAPGEEGKAARTRVRPLEALEGATSVEAEPLTGRTHQIRVHLASRGHPLLVDHQYGRAFGVDRPLVVERLGQAPVLARTPLHACELRLPELEGIGAETIVSPLAPDLARALVLLRPGAR